jgi:hypothetical protein
MPDALFDKGPVRCRVIPWTGDEARHLRLAVHCEARFDIGNRARP